VEREREREEKGQKEGERGGTSERGGSSKKMAFEVTAVTKKKNHYDCPPFSFGTLFVCPGVWHNVTTMTNWYFLMFRND
jgi:hypothetical protein